jgi:ParB family chromosome partitioning protein
MSTIIGKRRALGRGLAALIPEAAAPSSGATGTAVGDGGSNGGAGTHGNGSNAVGVRADGLFVVAIEDVHPGPHQPRKTFDDERLDELAESIRTQGIIQPLVVRRSPSGSGFELIAGERRWRAAQRAGLHEVPVVVREVAERQAFEMALVENLQRADLNPIEEAEGYQRLFAEFGYTQEALADRVGKDRSTVANALRLLRLPPAVRELVVGGRLAMGHARALLGLDSDASIDRLARQTVARDLSVRQVEALVRKERQDATAAAPAKPTPEPPSAAARDLTQRLERSLGTRVKLVQLDPTRGHLEIQYHSLDQLDGLLDKLLGPGSA